MVGSGVTVGVGVLVAVSVGVGVGDKVADAVGVGLAAVSCVVDWTQAGIRSATNRKR
jgi:hypothetical protein